jgi:hypothetical protein
VVICGLLVAAIALFAVSGPAQAATPTASLSITSGSISAGTQPVITYITSGVPAGAVIYLQLSSGSSQHWQDVGRIGADSGSVRAPADPAGQWSYRIQVAQGNTTVATSAASTVTVTASAGHTSTSKSSCTACRIAKDALPWLEQIIGPIVAPVLVPAIQSIGGAILDFLGWLFAF